MPKISRTVGQTSQIVEIALKSTLTSPIGLPLAGLLFNTSLLTCYYKRNTASASVPVSLVTIATLGTYASGGFEAVDGTNMIGLYEFHIPNAALVTGADTVAFCFQGAAGLAPYFLEIELTASNNQAADNGLGVASMPTTLVAGTYGEAMFAVDSTMLGRVNTAQGGTSNTITLDAGASSTAGAYVGDRIYLYGGTGGGIRGSGQLKVITAYNTSTKVATVSTAWSTTPDATTKFMTIPGDSLNPYGADSIIIDGGYNLPQTVSFIAAATAGTSSGVDTGTPAVYNGIGGSTGRISTTCSNGNRSAVTLTPPSI